MCAIEQRLADGQQVLIAFVSSAALALIVANFTSLINLIEYMEEHQNVDYHDTTIVRKLVNWLVLGLHWLIPAALKRLVETNLDSTANGGSLIPKCSCAGCLSTTCSCCEACCCIPSLAPSRREQVRALNHTLMLALSDTQMATGIGILSVAWARRKAFTVYQFVTATNLAWMSSNVHLLAVTQLREYFASNPDAKHWRAIGMATMFVLLFVANIYQGHYALYDVLNVPAQCLFDDFSLSNIGGEPARYMFAWSAFLLFEYPRRLGSLYSHTDAVRLRMHTWRAKYSTPTQVTWLKWPILVLYDLLWIFFGQAWGTVVIATSWFIYCNEDLWATRRNAHAYGILGNENVWGFGQILPLALLVLPIFSSMQEFAHTRAKSGKPPLLSLAWKSIKATWI